MEMLLDFAYAAVTVAGCCVVLSMLWRQIIAVAKIKEPSPISGVDAPARIS